MLITERVLCVIDGGKGLHKAVQDVLGTAAVIQRCQLIRRAICRRCCRNPGRRTCAR